MKKARIVLVAVVWAMSLVGVGLWAQGTSTTQQPPAVPLPLPNAVGTIDGMRTQAGSQSQVITGVDIGFRPVGSPDKDGRVEGTVVVRMNGVWHETKGLPRIVR